MLYKQLAQVKQGAVQAISTGQKRVLHKYHNQLQEVKQGAVRVHNKQSVQVKLTASP